MRISDWSSDVCSSDLMAGAQPRPCGRHIKSAVARQPGERCGTKVEGRRGAAGADIIHGGPAPSGRKSALQAAAKRQHIDGGRRASEKETLHRLGQKIDRHVSPARQQRSEEQTSELKSLMRD